jgi:hypothetical protein
MFGKRKNDADEIAKLADLRARGALNDAEYEIQKAKLVHGRPRRRWPWWNWALAFVALGVYLAVKYAPADDTPDCDDESVRQKVVELANQQSQALTESALGPLLSAAAAGIATRVIAVTNGQTLFHDKDSGFRACVASAAIERDHAPIGFTIEWHDKEKGEYLVQLSNAAALEARYGVAASSAAASAAPDATSDQAASSAPDVASAAQATAMPASDSQSQSAASASDAASEPEAVAPVSTSPQAEPADSPSAEVAHAGSGSSAQ